MNIQQMHTAFRTMGQQAGLQLVRGILPEAIDVYLNDTIYEMTRQELLAGAKVVFQDNVNLQTTALGPINILRSLYRTKEICLTPSKDTIKNNEGKDNYTDTVSKIILPWIKSYNPDLGYYEIYLPTSRYGIDPINGGKLNNKPYDGIYKLYSTYLAGDTNFKTYGIDINPMMYVGCSLQYNKESIEKVGGFNGTNRTLGAKGLGDHVGCRLIGGDTLETTFRDYCNAASVENPVVSLMSDGIGREYVEVYTNTKDLVVKTLIIKYIKTPDSVHFDVDLSKCVDCDLPDYIHFEIVRRAVGKFFATLGGGQRNDNNSNNSN